MSNEIIIVTDQTRPHWEDKDAVHFGFIDEDGWETLFFAEFGIKTYLSYTSEGETNESYDDYFARQLSILNEEYPLIARFHDFYKRAAFSKNEIGDLIEEIHKLRPIIRLEQAGELLDQLLGVSEFAIKHNAGFITSPD